MKFAPFCLVLAVLSPTFALKGRRSQLRRLQDTDVSETATVSETDVALSETTDAVETSESFGNLPFNVLDITPAPTAYVAPTVSPAPTPTQDPVDGPTASTTSTSGMGFTEEIGDTTKEDKNEETELTVEESEEAASGQDKDNDETETVDTGAAEAAATAETADTTETAEEMVTENIMYSEQYPAVDTLDDDDGVFAEDGAYTEDHKNNDNKNKYTGKSGSSRKGGLVVDGLCEDFCHTYLSTCENANAFVDPKYPRGAPARRLIAGYHAYNEPTRLKGSVFQSATDCETACAGYPRPFDQNAIGDTFWCRQRQLNLAASSVNPFAAQTHCPAASPSGGGICTNIELTNHYNYKNATAWEFIRAGSDTGRHLGYCQMYYNDFVADCTNAGIDDITISMALFLIPTDTSIIILNNNFDITTLTDTVFENLMCPECIEAVIIDEGNVATIGSATFSVLTFVEQISLNMQAIMTLPSGLLDNNVYLREFTMYNTLEKQGKLMTIPDDFFRFNPLLERLVISGHTGLALLPSCMFCNVLANDNSVLKTLIMSNNGLTNTGVVSGMFNNLGELRIWDFSGNQFTKGNAGWFAGGWGFNLKYIYLYDNPIDYLDDNIFDRVEKLEVALLHDTDLISVPVGVFDNNPYLISYTLSPRPR